MTESFIPSPFTVAAAQYPIDRLENWQAYADKLSAWVAGAAAQGARLAVFPEYGAMELASLDARVAGDLVASLDFVSGLLPRVDALHAELARAHGLYILAASAPFRRADGRCVNRARLFGPSGAMGWQDKRMMTRFEAEQWGVSPGEELSLFETALGRIGIAICYDSEFPLIARALAGAGADLLLLPSCTDTVHGYWRVRHGAAARALENQLVVVQAPTVGEAAWSPAVDVNRGAAGVFAPPDGMFPADGVVALGEADVPCWVYARIDPGQARALRAGGAVLNHRDWARQPGAAALPPPRIVRLD